MNIDEITGMILDESIRIHRTFGPGMLESVYERMLAAALRRRGLTVEEQKSISFTYDGMQFEDAFRLDLLVNDCVVVELKSTERNIPVYAKQVKTYLKVLHLNVGLLINFGMATLKEGFARIVDKFDSSQSLLRINQQEQIESRGNAEGRSPVEPISFLSNSSSSHSQNLRPSSSPRENNPTEEPL